MWKNHKTPPRLANKDGRSKDLTSTSDMYRFSDKEFREKMQRMFKDLKETMKLTKQMTNETQEEIRQK